MHETFTAKINETLTEEELQLIHHKKTEEETLAENIAFFERFNAAKNKVKEPKPEPEFIKNVFTNRFKRE